MADDTTADRDDRVAADDTNMRSGVADERPAATAAGARDGDDTTLRSGVADDDRGAYEQGREDESRFQRETRREDHIER